MIHSKKIEYSNNITAIEYIIYIKNIRQFE